MLNVASATIICTGTGCKLLPEHTYLITRSDTKRCVPIAKDFVESRVPAGERRSDRWNPLSGTMGVDIHEYTTDESGRPVAGTHVFSIHGDNAHMFIGSVFSWFQTA